MARRILVFGPIALFLLLAAPTFYLERAIIWSGCDPEDICGRWIPGAAHLEMFTNAFLRSAVEQNVSQLESLALPGTVKLARTQVGITQAMAALKGRDLADLVVTSTSFPEGSGEILSIRQGSLKGDVLVQVPAALQASTGGSSRWYLAY